MWHKTDAKDFNQLQQQITGISLNDATNAYAFHGALDIFLRFQGIASVTAIDEEANIPRFLETLRNLWHLTK